MRENNLLNLFSGIRTLVLYIIRTNVLFGVGFMDFEKWVGTTVEIVYLSKNKKLTKRRINILSVDQVHIKAFCLDRQGRRNFLVDNILAAEPVVVFHV